MGVFDFAMQMELDGKTYYEEEAAKTELPQLKKLLLELAGDEQKHYNLFKAMKAGEQVSYEAEGATRIFSSAKTVFEDLRSSGEEFAFAADVREAWAKALDVEKKTEAFYRQKADEIDDAGQKEVLVRIAEEEFKHWTAIEHVISFLDHPKNWLDNAEWSGLSDG
jgi:rubrerythrin